MSWSYTHHEQYPSFTVVYNLHTINYVQFQPQHPVKPNNFLHTILTFAIPVILSLIELKCQCKSDSPFQTNPVAMWLGVSCLVAYCLAQGFDLACSSSGANSRTPVRCASVLFGSLCLASLVSVLYPDKTKFAVFGLYALLSAGEIARKNIHVRQTWHWMREKIRSGLFRCRIGEGEIRVSSDANSLARRAFSDRFDALPV